MTRFPKVAWLLAGAASLVLGTAAAVAQSPSPSPSGTPTPSPTTTPSATPSPTQPATPTPAGTPWPAPADVALDTTVTITNPDGSFIPLEQRVATSIVSWQQLPGYTGVFEVERALVPYNSGQPRVYTRIATVPAAPEPAMVGYPDTYPFAELLQSQRCYRVRTVVNGETGPYSAEVCTQAPPSTGPAPGAPNTGTGTATPGGASPARILALAAVIVAGTTALTLARRRRQPAAAQR
ncbi:MAG: hypothetical protein IT303_09725 [Dehalococcoidia bacterium]|nr:hypothetical protein [Dehalococcoidia bacterium]